MTQRDPQDTPENGVHPDDIPTKKQGILQCPIGGAHEKEVRCTCICHKYTTIHHQKDCCKPCDQCGFRAKIFYEIPKDDGDEEA